MKRFICMLLIAALTFGLFPGIVCAEGGARCDGLFPELEYLFRQPE